MQRKPPHLAALVAVYDTIMRPIFAHRGGRQGPDVVQLVSEYFSFVREFAERQVITDGIAVQLFEAAGVRLGPDHENSRNHQVGAAWLHTRSETK
jgi:hypothetical protein